MANILYSVKQGSNFRPNKENPDFTVSIDADIETSEIGNYLPDNGQRYKTIDYASILPTGSSATIYSPNYVYICSFIAESGSINLATGMQGGIWKCMAKVEFK
jgi:hypothetical protein